MARTRLAVAFSLAVATAAAAQSPPACGPGGAFPDVPQSHPFCAWIQQLAQDQLATSCDGTNFCPDAPVTRAQFALYLWRLTRGTPTSQVDADTLDGFDSSTFGDITGVSTSGGLSGGATSGAVSLAIADGGVTTGKIENGSILFEDLAANGCAGGNVIQRTGSAWTCGSISAPVAFVHTVTNLNTVGSYSILDNAAINNSATVKLWVTLDNTNGAGPNVVVAVKRIDLGPPFDFRWVIEMMNGGTPPLNATFNVLVMP